MRLAKIVGIAQSLIKSDKLYGTDILIAAPVDLDTLTEEDDTFLVLDHLGAKAGQIVVCSSNGGGDEQVIAIPESLEFEGKRYFEQIAAQQEAPKEEYIKAPIPDIYDDEKVFIPQQEDAENVDAYEHEDADSDALTYISATENVLKDEEESGDALADLRSQDELPDGVSELSAEFEALHKELDNSIAQEKADILSSSPPQTTSSVPYEEYAKYLTTDFKPPEAVAESYVNAGRKIVAEETEEDGSSVQEEPKQTEKTKFTRLDKYRSKKKK